ncbi:hypothetical protein ACFWY9_33355 [Amycolatopsis sp. NPDC059027]|uniref:hypothetical protein n=1 Tax=Amycolatopsis sp. NPDC059027 TaxID=3346709 RepID=UPI00366A8574
MSAVIYIDTDAIRPVVDGKWHHARLTHVPEPGEAITMLCGASSTAEFERSNRRDDHGAPHMCWDCDLVYRREHDMDVWPGHPALSRVPVPHPRSKTSRKSRKQQRHEQ